MDKIVTDAMLERRIRIRSWKDVVLILVVTVIYAALQFGLPKLFPQMSERTVRVIAVVVSFVFCLIVVFNMGD